MTIAVIASTRVASRRAGVRRVDSAGDLFEICQAAGVEVVFCDFAALADGLTGPRVSKRLREAGFAGRIYLLSESVASTQVQWAKCNGADDVILREIGAIERLIPGHSEAGLDIDLSDRGVSRVAVPAEEVVPDSVQIVSKALNEVALGPAASVVASQAWRQYRARVGEDPSVDQLAQLCVAHLEPSSEVRRRYWSLIREAVE